MREMDQSNSTRAQLPKSVDEEVRRERVRRGMKVKVVEST